MSELCGNMKSGDIAEMDRAFWAKRTVRVIVSRYAYLIWDSIVPRRTIIWAQFLNLFSNKIIHNPSNHAPLRRSFMPLWDGNEVIVSFFAGAE